MMAFGVGIAVAGGEYMCMVVRIFAMSFGTVKCRFMCLVFGGCEDDEVESSATIKGGQEDDSVLYHVARAVQE